MKGFHWSYELSNHFKVEKILISFWLLGHEPGGQWYPALLPAVLDSLIAPFHNYMHQSSLNPSASSASNGPLLPPSLPLLLPLTLSPASVR